MSEYKPKVKEKKKKALEDLIEMIKSYKIIGILDLYKLPSAQYQKIKGALASRAKIKVVKKTLLQRALETLGMNSLAQHIPNYPAVLFSNENPFKLYLFIDKNKSQAPAKAGDIATNDIVVNAGPTDIPPGPANSTLSKVKIPAKVEGGKITISKDVTVCKAGEKISQDLANALALLKLEPLQIGLNVCAVYESGLVYTKDVLAIDQTKILGDLSGAAQSALNLSVFIVWPTKSNINIMLAKAFTNAKTLGVEACILDKGVIDEIIAKANRHANALSSLIK
jgi:large subunit ribosomal protein L10